MFHATSNPDKQWPAGHWAALATQMMARGVRVLLPWGSAAEHDDATHIAARAPGAIVLPAMSVRELGAAIGQATLVVEVNTGFVHMAHALQRPTVMIFVATSRHHCGIGGAPNALSIGEPGAPPSVKEVIVAIANIESVHKVRPLALLINVSQVLLPRTIRGSRTCSSPAESCKSNRGRCSLRHSARKRLAL